MAINKAKVIEILREEYPGIAITGESGFDTKTYIKALLLLKHPKIPDESVAYAVAEKAAKKNSVSVGSYLDGYFNVNATNNFYIFTVECIKIGEMGPCIAHLTSAGRDYIKAMGRLTNRLSEDGFIDQLFE